MRYRVLGPIEVLNGGVSTSIAAAKERRLLGALLAEANRVVSPSRLIDELWGDEPPRTAGKTLQTYVSHLRRVVGDDIVTVAAGYQLNVADDELDASVFERLVGEGRTALAAGEGRRAARLLGEALDLWAGEPFDGESGEGLVGSASVRLAAMRIGALEDWFEARLVAGDSHELIDGLQGATGDHPLRERLWGLLMVAQYRSGCQADALATYQRVRRHLNEELGIEPGPDLRALEAAVLSQTLDLGGSGATAGPVTRYAETADGLRIGYASMGDGGPDVLLCVDWVFNLELLWEMDGFRPLFEGLAERGRLTIVQRRDTGVSDPSLDDVFAPPEACVPDLDAVLDALGAGAAHLVGWGHGSQVALAYAATRPARAISVAAISGYASLCATDGNPTGYPSEFAESWLEMMRAVWGRDVGKGPIFGPRGDDPSVIQTVARQERLIASPRRAVEIQRAVSSFDVGPLLGSVVCPTLVVGLTSSVTGLDNARNLAERLPNARYLELPGYFAPAGDEVEAIAAEVASTVR